jgi:REP element-mobilizing transposase RayT
MNVTPLAYHITWTTYGSWLPGDRRGWVRRGASAVQVPDSETEDQARAAMAEASVVLTESQREVVAQTVRDHCLIRRWTLHAVNARSNHVHVVATAGVSPERVLDQLKAWCSRRLNAATCDLPAKWRTYHGSTKYIWDEPYLREAIDYVLERQ